MALRPAKAAQGEIMTPNESQYRQNSIKTAKPEDLLLMLYNGMLKFLGQAIRRIEEGDVQEAHNQILRVEDILLELQVSLDMNYDVSISLALLYDYIYRRLVEANSRKDKDALWEVAGLIRELRDTWGEAQRQIREGGGRQAPEAKAEAEADDEQKSRAYRESKAQRDKSIGAISSILGVKDESIESMVKKRNELLSGDLRKEQQPSAQEGAASGAVGSNVNAVLGGEGLPGASEGPADQAVGAPPRMGARSAGGERALGEGDPTDPGAAAEVARTVEAVSESVREIALEVGARAAGGGAGEPGGMGGEGEAQTERPTLLNQPRNPIRQFPVNVKGVYSKARKESQQPAAGAGKVNILSE